MAAKKATPKKKTTAVKKKATTKKTTVTKKAPAKIAAKKAPVKAAAKTTKTAAKKVVAKKTVAKKAPTTRAKRVSVKEAYTKTQIQTFLAESMDMPKKQVATLLEELGNLIEGHLKSKAVGEFTLPGLLKVKVVRKPATRARKGVNPFTGEETVFKAKPARNVVKIKPLKKLKDMVS